jgi:gluconolactonase
MGTVATTICTIPFSGPLAEICGPNNNLERVASGFCFVEGPVWYANQNSLLFSDIIGDALFRLGQTGDVETYRQPSHMANGNTLDREGRLLTCEHASSRVSRTSVDGDYEVIASHYEDLELNSPNDIIVRSDGSIYFTDPNSGRTKKYGVDREQELDFQGVYRLGPDTGELTLLIDDFVKPNGLCFSLDESVLFINDTSRQHIRAFDVMEDGSICNSHVWASTDGELPGVADGMKIDSQSNLYCCGSGGIHVFDPSGTPLGVIVVPEVAANFTWGGEHLSDLYITATHSIYRLSMNVRGHDPLASSPGDVPP